MTRLGKILAVGALVAAPLAIAAIPAQPANAQFYVGVGPAYPYPYACSYYDPYCSNYAYYDYGWPGYVGWGWGGGYGGYGGYYGHGWGHGWGHGGWHGGYAHRGFHGGGGGHWHR